MVCRNPGSPYLVVFDPEARTFVLDPDTSASSYTVLAIEGSTVAGAVGYDSGLSFLADFAEPRHIDFYAGSEVVQTDPCEDR